jgi:hypothetical protein
MADVEVDILPPLADCFLHCETECVRECCGIDAISTDPGLIVEWSHNVGPETSGQALGQLRQLVAAVEDRSHKVRSQFLNHFTVDDEAREQLLSFLEAFRSAIQAEN